MKLKKWDQVVVRGKIITIIWISENKYMLSDWTWCLWESLEWLRVLDDEVSEIEWWTLLRVNCDIYEVELWRGVIGNSMIPKLNKIKRE